MNFEKLIRFDGRRVVRREHLASRNRSCAPRTPRDDRRVQGEHSSRQLRGWIGVGEASADSASIADVDMPDLADSRGQQRPALSDDGRALDRPLPGHGAEGQSTILNLQKRQLGHSVQVDQMRGPGQAEIHERHEALPASERLRFVAQLGQGGQRFVERCRRVVDEGGWFHWLVILPE